MEEDLNYEVAELRKRVEAIEAGLIALTVYIRTRLGPDDEA